MTRRLPCLTRSRSGCPTNKRSSFSAPLNPPGRCRPPLQALKRRVPGPLGYQWKFNEASEIVGGSISYRIDANGDIGAKTFTWNLFSPAFQQDALTTPERYDTVQLGMSYEQVVEALGSPGRFFIIREDLLPMAPLVGNMQTGWAFLHGARVSMDVFWWPEDAKNAGDSMRIMFINNEVISKSYQDETITQ